MSLARFRDTALKGYGVDYALSHLAGIQDIPGSNLCNIRRPVSLVQDLFYRGFYRVSGLGKAQGVAEHQGHAENGGNGVGLALAGDVRGAAVDRLVEAHG